MKEHFNQEMMQQRADRFVARAVERGRISDTAAARGAWNKAFMNDPQVAVEMLGADDGRETVREQELRAQLDREGLGNEEKLKICNELRNLRGHGEKKPKRGAPPVPTSE